MPHNITNNKNITNTSRYVACLLLLLIWEVVAADLLSGKRVYLQTCASCHATGAAGAPKLSDAQAWKQRLSLNLPISVLQDRVINGFGAMPPKGGNPSLSDAEVRHAVAYMVLNAGAVPRKENGANGANITDTKVDKNDTDTQQPSAKAGLTVVQTQIPKTTGEVNTGEVNTEAQTNTDRASDEPMVSGEHNAVSDQVLIDEQMVKVVPPSSDRKNEIEKSKPEVSNSKVLVEYLRRNQPYHIPPTEDLIPNDMYGQEVRLGKKIFTETPKYASRYSGNGLSCSNCHLDAGRKPNSAPMWAAYGVYPAYRAKNDRTNSLQERVQQCFLYSMNGFAPSLDSPELRALLSYFHFLSKGVPVGVKMPGRGFPQIVNTGSDPNPNRGTDVYKGKCAACHGEDGGGKRNPQGGYIYPPLWGSDSYNKGAGFFDNQLLAGFIKANMPVGQDWALTDQQALDVAAYINLQIRPWDPRKGFIEGIFQ